ncbi:uncharacterized protein LOC117640821 [Thrips palmi]|uniref:Uncharacterized protein LOC117640821 n=1 Tax=Thrips palmi TaxID=161013 RepID=A0A6P8YI51_THRPL|nr:uncharacterized protein LOC117640821 [Thrips palmi]XP_034233632.1 uncharacterized protein LOC117640821 [Thrips palmi]
MDNINSDRRDGMSSDRVQVKMENWSDGSTGVSQRHADPTSSAMLNLPFSDDFQFKTPSPVCKPSRSSNLSKTSPSSKSQSWKVEPSPEGPKLNSSQKKKPAVKIASFAKASPVDRLAPSHGNVDPASLKKSLDGSGASMTAHITAQNTCGGSKQPMTQTSLPTPALNAALRSFFNFNPQSDSNPNDIVQSDEEDEEDDDNEDVEEEEILVYMQFDSKLDSDLLQPHTPFKIIGVDSEKPVLQLGNQVFEGNWSDTVGTAVFFEENPSASPGDPVFMKNPPVTLNYHSKTQKALVMSRIFVKPKEDNDEENNVMVPMAIVEVAPGSTE